MYEFRGEEALNACIDVAEPIFTIFADDEIQDLQKNGAPIVAYVKPILKKYRAEIITVLARLASADGIDPDEYLDNVGVLTVPLELVELMRSKTIMGLFSSQSQSRRTSSGSAQENTEAEEQ